LARHSAPGDVLVQTCASEGRGLWNTAPQPTARIAWAHCFGHRREISRDGASAA
jgi:hypothetical protein